MNTISEQDIDALDRFLQERCEDTNGFFSVELLDNLHVVRELKGQHFTAGHGAESMTDITGQVVYGSGDISFRNLSGTVGASRWMNNIAPH